MIGFWGNRPSRKWRPLTTRLDETGRNMTTYSAVALLEVKPYTSSDNLVYTRSEACIVL